MWNRKGASRSDMKRYLPIEVWSRLGDQRLVRYRCFQIQPDGSFCVQSADFFTRPAEPDRLKESDLQFLDLFLEQAPDERSEVFGSLEEAIEHHEKEFASLDSPDL